MTSNLHIKSRRKTIFRQLIFNIAIPTLIVLLVFAGINFWQTRAFLVKRQDEENRLLSNEVGNILKFQNIAVNLIDNQFTNRIKELSSLLVNKYFANTSKLELVNLRAIANEIGLDSLNEDIYIISSSGIVINTTFVNDIGLNLFNLGEKMKEYLQNILKSREFVADQFAIEYNTRRAKKYTYQPTKDGKYIIELGAYSKQMDEIFQAIEDTKKELRSNAPGIIDVELFYMADKPFSLNKNYLYVEDQQDILLRAFREKDTINLTEKVGNSWYHYQYIYVEGGFKGGEGNSFYKESVIRIISDITEQHFLFRKEVKKFILLVTLIMLLLIIVIYNKTRAITRPIKKLVDKVKRISSGNLRERAEVIGNNEITILAEQFNNMVDNIELQNKNLLEQKTEIEKINSEIITSILYAQRIQSAILPPEGYITELLNENFIFFKPKDIVSGDFYWIKQVKHYIILASADCTGHGVPGAFMSMLGISYLNEIVQSREITQANQILNELRKKVKHSLRQTGKKEESRDGIDIALCVIDSDKNLLQYSGAHQPLFIISNSTGESVLKEIKADPMPVGVYFSSDKSFTNHEIQLEIGDTFYIFSDGYIDQIGGDNNHRFTNEMFKKLLLEIHDLPMHEQKEILERTLNDWMGIQPQRDDILVIGARM